MDIRISISALANNLEINIRMMYNPTIQMDDIFYSLEGSNLMPIISIIVVLIIVGVLLWLVNTYIPMARPIKTIINVVAVIFVILWLLSLFGVFSL